MNENQVVGEPLKHVAEGFGPNPKIPVPGAGDVSTVAPNLSSRRDAEEVSYEGPAHSKPKAQPK